MHEIRDDVRRVGEKQSAEYRDGEQQGPSTALARREAVEQQCSRERHPREEEIPEEEPVGRGSRVVGARDDERAAEQLREHERENRCPRLANGNEAFLHGIPPDSNSGLSRRAVILSAGPSRKRKTLD